MYDDASRRARIVDCGRQRPLSHNRGELRVPTTMTQKWAELSSRTQPVGFTVGMDDAPLVGMLGLATIAIQAICLMGTAKRQKCHLN